MYSFINILSNKNTKYAKMYEEMNLKLNTVRNRERFDSIRLTQDNVDKKVNQISRKDVRSHFQI